MRIEIVEKNFESNGLLGRHYFYIEDSGDGEGTIGVRDVNWPLESQLKMKLEKIMSENIEEFAEEYKVSSIFELQSNQSITGECVKYELVDKLSRQTKGKCVQQMAS